MKTLFRHIMMTVLLSGCISSMLFAQTSKPSESLLNDIEIMETVLDKLIKSNRSHPVPFGTNSKGFYLYDYGVIFNTDYSFPSEKLFTVKAEGLFYKYRAATVRIDEEEKVEKKKFDVKEEIQKIEQSLTRFLGTYASSIRDLNPDERVTVIIDFNGFAKSFRTTSDEIPYQIIASVEMEDLKKYRQGNLSEQAFSKKIEFRRIEFVEEDISILANVIKTSLEHTDGIDLFGSRNEVKGFRFEGHGVLFITNVSLGSAEIHKIFLNGTVEKEFAFVSEKYKGKKNENYQENIKQLEQKLLHSISTYGHSLRNLNPNDWIEIAINFKDVVADEKYSKSIIKVKKKAIDEYYRDKINFDQFKNAVHIIYY